MKLKEYKKPWKTTLRGIKWRVKDKKGKGAYYRKGIKCLIASEELKILWFRDRAYLMKEPSIDRKDNNGDYTFENCQYLEFNKNRGKMDKETLNRIAKNTKKYSKLRWKNPKYRKLVSKSTKKQWENPEFKKTQSKRAKERMIKNWENPEYRKKRSRQSKRYAKIAKRNKYGRFIHK